VRLKGNMKTVLVTGASGLIGRHLCRLLETKGYSIHVLGRSMKKDISYKQFVWDIGSGTVDLNVFKGVNAIIHLAGANISEGRWTKTRQQEIRDSRVKSIDLLYNSVKKVGIQLEAFISSSAIGYYGAITSDTVFTESDSPAGDFIGGVCLEWELAADALEKHGVRTVKLRTGVVLTAKGGPLAKMVQPIQLRFGSALGKGSQFMPWIHVDDLCQMYVQSLEDPKMSGPYNAVAPEHVTNRQVTESIGAVLKRKIWLPNVPSFLLKLIFGEMAVIFLQGSRVSSSRIKKTGFQFQYEELDGALKNLLPFST